MKNSLSKIRFIHIGKCGGSSLKSSFRKCNIRLTEIHCRKPNFRKTLKYIIWLRNPLSRFVSAFNYSYDCITFDIKGLKTRDINLHNCLGPMAIRKKIKTGHAFPGHNWYEESILSFKSANILAESLSSSNLKRQKESLKLMNSRKEHIFKGIGWYLNNGDWVKKHNSNILFVGKVEKMSEDLNILGSKLNLSLKEQKIRVNNSSKISKSLSSKAIKNLLKFYKETDYAALISLYEKGWLTKKELNSYYEY